MVDLHDIVDEPTGRRTRSGGPPTGLHSSQIAPSNSRNVSDGSDTLSGHDNGTGQPSGPAPNLHGAAAGAMTLEARQNLRIALQASYDNLSLAYVAAIQSGDQAQEAATSERMTRIQAMIQQHEKILYEGSKPDPQRTADATAMANVAKEREKAITRLVKVVVPKLSATSTSLVDLENWSSTVLNQFLLCSADETCDPERAIWALGGIQGPRQQRARLLQSRCHAEGVLFSWGLLLDTVRSSVSDPTIREASTAISFFNVKKLASQSYDDFLQYCLLLEQDANIVLDERNRKMFY